MSLNTHSLGNDPKYDSVVFFRCLRKGSGESVSGFFTIAFTVKVSLSTPDLPIPGLLRTCTYVCTFCQWVHTSC